MKAVVDEGRWLATQPSTSLAELEDRFEAEIDSGLFVVAEEGGEIIGSTALTETAIDGVWRLGSWVSADRRGSGIGRAMMDSILDLAAERGLRKVELEVFAENEAAIALYRSAGFEVEGLRRDHYLGEDGSLKSALLMALFPAKRDPG